MRPACIPFALLVALTTTACASRSGESPPTDRERPRRGRSEQASPPPTAFALAPRYASTFDADSTGCRGGTPVAAYDGEVVLTSAQSHTTLELTFTPKDVLGELPFSFSPPLERKPAKPTVCRWSGTGTPMPGRWHASLERTDDLDPTACGDRLPLALDCRPGALDLPDAPDTPVLRCTLGTPHPAVLWVLTGSDEIILSDRALHLQLRANNFGIPSQAFTRAPPPPPPPPPPSP